MKLSRTRDSNIFCLNSSVQLIEIVVMGILKQILMNPPLKRAKNPSWLNI